MKDVMENEDEVKKKRKSDIGNRLAEIVKYANMYPIRRRQVLTTSYDRANKSRTKKINLKYNLNKFSTKVNHHQRTECERDLGKADPSLVFKFFN